MGLFLVRTHEYKKVVQSTNPRSAVMDAFQEEEPDVADLVTWVTPISNEGRKKDYLINTITVFRQLGFLIRKKQ